MKLFRFLLSVLVAAAFLSAVPAKAQLGVYGNFSAAKLNVPNTNWIYGPGFGAYLDHGHFVFLSAGIDIRGQVLGSGGTTQFDAGYIGPRLVVRPHVLPVQPYVEALAGVGHAQFGQGASQTSTTKFSYQFVGGLDYTLLPRIDWRVAEFSYGGLSILGNSLNPKTISTGIVIRLPAVF
jgi:hypothetical protein